MADASSTSPWLVVDPSQTPAPTDTSASTSSGLPDWVTNLFGTGANGLNMAGLGAAGLATAAQQYHNAGAYQDTANQAAALANPFGDRTMYKDKLAQSYNDPNAFLNDPGHQAILQRGMQNVAGQDAMRGYLGSGNMMKDLGSYQTQSDYTFLDQERQRLANLAGAQFDPQNAASDIMKGGDQKIQSQNAALQDLLMPFMAALSQPKGTTINNNNGANPLSTDNFKSLTPAAIAAIPKFASPADVAKWFSDHASMAGGSAADLIKAYVNSPGGDPATMSLLASMKQDPTYAPFFQQPTGPGVGGTNPFDPNNTNTGSNGSLGTGGEPTGTVTVGPITRLPDGNGNDMGGTAPTVTDIANGVNTPVGNSSSNSFTDQLNQFTLD